MDETLKNLPPKERAEALRLLREKKQRELEEFERKQKQELDEAKDQELASLEEAKAEEKEELSRQKKEQEALEKKRKEEQEFEEESLEERLAQAKTNTKADENNLSYRLPQEQQGYTPITTIVDDLQRLSYTSSWGETERNLYVQRKEELEQTQNYRSTLSEDLTNKLDVAKGLLDHMGYHTYKR